MARASQEGRVRSRNREMDGTSLVVQWLRFCASNAGGLGSIPGWGSKTPHEAKKKKKKHSKMEMSKDVQDTWGKKDWKNRLRNDDAELSKSD